MSWEGREGKGNEVGAFRSSSHPFHVVFSSPTPSESRSLLLPHFSCRLLRLSSRLAEFEAPRAARRSYWQGSKKGGSLAQFSRLRASPTTSPRHVEASLSLSPPSENLLYAPRSSDEDRFAQTNSASPFLQFSWKLTLSPPSFGCSSLPQTSISSSLLLPPRMASRSVPFRS